TTRASDSRCSDLVADALVHLGRQTFLAPLIDTTSAPKAPPTQQRAVNEIDAHVRFTAYSRSYQPQTTHPLSRGDGFSLNSQPDGVGLNGSCVGRAKREADLTREKVSLDNR